MVCSGPASLNTSNAVNGVYRVSIFCVNFLGRKLASEFGISVGEAIRKVARPPREGLGDCDARYAPQVPRSWRKVRRTLCSSVGRVA
jgi:hypothetical protein